MPSGFGPVIIAVVAAVSGVLVHRTLKALEQPQEPAALSYLKGIPVVEDVSRQSKAAAIYESIARLPLICPHTHVDARVFAENSFNVAGPGQLIVAQDHYILRMLYSQGVDLDALGRYPLAKQQTSIDADTDRKIWNEFSSRYKLFRGTPSGLWVDKVLRETFSWQSSTGKGDGDSGGGPDLLSSKLANKSYDHLSKVISSPDFSPRRAFEKFNIEVLCTTDSATSDLRFHKMLNDSSSALAGLILPTFRPDALLDLADPSWKSNVAELASLVNMTIKSFEDFLQAIEKRRLQFKDLGCVATDHGLPDAFTYESSLQKMSIIFNTAYRRKGRGITSSDAKAFRGYMILEMARMSINDGLVMQLHIGIHRNHNEELFKEYGPDAGADIPIMANFVDGLKPLLNKFGDSPHLRIIVFTLDESIYSRELAPLAGHYPALFIGPPWWFHDSRNGIRRYLDLVTETAGVYNLAGFNDDARAFPSIPARHDVWRRSISDWLSGLEQAGIISHAAALDMAYELAYGQVKRLYNLRTPGPRKA